MVNALADANEADVVLVARRASGDRRPADTIARDCGLHPRISLILLPSSRLFAGLKLLATINGRMVNGDSVDAVYSRVLPIFLGGIAASQRIFEMHEPPRANWRFKPAIFDRVVRSGAITDLIFVSESLKRIVEHEHQTVLHKNNVVRHVFHSGGPSPGEYCVEPSDKTFTVAYAGKLEKLDCNLVAELARSDPSLNIIIYSSYDSAFDRFADLPNIELRGWIEPSKLQLRLQEANLLIAPYSDLLASEWFSPVKIFDYAAAGRAMLVSDHAPVREIFPDGSIGRLLPQGNIGSWRAAISELRVDPAKRAEMGRASLAFAEAYSFTARARRILDMVRRAHTGSPASREVRS
jgi:glycosyltransferase involved in cell wall biosynthesis